MVGALYSRVRGGLIAVSVLLLVTGASSARVWRVPSEIPTIPAAAESSAYGDTILVAPGTYVRPDNTDCSYYWIGLPSGVSLIGAGGAAETIIVDHAVYYYPDFVIAASDVSDCLVRGFSFVRDVRPVHCFHGIMLASATDCYVDSCTFDGFEYGIWAQGRATHSDTPCVRWCAFTDCVVGVQCDAQPGRCPVIQYNDFSRCVWGIYCVNSGPYIADNLISDSWSSGVYCRGRSAAWLDRNVIVNSGECGLYVDTDVYWEPYMATDWLAVNGNSIYNSGGYDLYSAVEDQRGVVEARCTYWGSTCPDFAKVIGGPGRVTYMPWCDSTHTHTYGECPPDDGTEPMTWGSVKALFK